MSEQEQTHSSFHLKNGTDKSGRLPISEQYLQEKELPNQTEDINTKGMTETAILRLKSTQEPSTNKTNSIAGSSYSITASYQDMIKDQQGIPVQTEENDTYLQSYKDNHYRCSDPHSSICLNLFRYDPSS